MRAYLPITHGDLATFLNSGSKEVESIYAPTPFYVGDNSDLDEEEIEYLLSFEAAQESLELRSSNHAPGITLAIELEPAQVNQVEEKSVTLNSAITWDQVRGVCVPDQLIPSYDHGAAFQTAARYFHSPIVKAIS